MLQLTSTTAADLRREVCRAVNRSYGSVGGSSASEPLLVAALNESTIAYANPWRAILERIYPNLALGVASVFTHQTPIVDYCRSDGTRGKCELADILVAVIDRRDETPLTPARGRAMLLQAKKSQWPETAISVDDKQFELLSRKPTFSIIKPQNGPVDIDLSKMIPDVGVSYLFANERGGYKHSIDCTLGRHWLIRDDLGSIRSIGNRVAINTSDSFASVLVGMLQGIYGWEFTMPLNGESWESCRQVDDWSALISYLLATTYSKELSKGISKKLREAGIAGDQENRFYRGRDHESLLAVNGFVRLLHSKADNGDDSELMDWHQDRPRFAGGEGNGTAEFPSYDEYAPGPISAIVFEIDNNYESDR